MTIRINEWVHIREKREEERNIVVHSGIEKNVRRYKKGETIICESVDIVWNENW